MPAAENGIVQGGLLKRSFCSASTLPSHAACSMQSLRLACASEPTPRSASKSSGHPETGSMRTALPATASCAAVASLQSGFLGIVLAHILAVKLGRDALHHATAHAVGLACVGGVLPAPFTVLGGCGMGGPQAKTAAAQKGDDRAHQEQSMVVGRAPVPGALLGLTLDRVCRRIDRRISTAC